MEDNKQLICPHCKTEYDIDKYESYFLYDSDDIEELQCGACEKHFRVKVNTTFRFSTAIDEDNL
jgi:transcription elongation factor Elf1